MLQLSCKNCGELLKSENMNLDALIARCDSCGAVLQLNSDEMTGRSQAGEKGPVALPDKISVDHDLEGLVIRRKWFSAVYIFFIFFALFWNGFMVFWHWIALSAGQYLMSAFGIIHTAIGIGLIYNIFAGFLNITEIRIAQGILSIQHKPLPWPGNKSVQSNDIDQIYCKEHVRRNKGNYTYTYQVVVRLKSGIHEKLLKSLPKPEQALFIEQELEKYLEIRDEAVSGEFRE